MFDLFPCTFLHCCPVIVCYEGSLLLFLVVRGDARVERWRSGDLSSPPTAAGKVKLTLVPVRPGAGGGRSSPACLVALLCWLPSQSEQSAKQSVVLSTELIWQADWPSILRSSGLSPLCSSRENSYLSADDSIPSDSQ